MTRAARFRRLLAQGLVAAFLDGSWSPSEMTERGAEALGRSPRWLGAMARRAHAAFHVMASDCFGEVATAIERDPASRRPCWNDVSRCASAGSSVRRPRWVLASAPGLRRPSLPTTSGDIATWLNEDVAHLTWLADWRGLARLTRDPRLRHYVYRWMPKRTGGVRLLEAPKPTLKAIQRRILREILDRVPPHEAAHGFRSGRSVLTHAHSHAGKNAVLRMDLEDFFTSIPAGRVYGVFRSLGYPEEAARVLTGLCTSRVLPPRGLEPLLPGHRVRAGGFVSCPYALPHASPAARRADIAVARKPLCLWAGCSPRGRGRSGRCDL